MHWRFKFESSADLEVSCKTWNQLLGLVNYLSSCVQHLTLCPLLLCNLQQWSVQCDTKCSLCDSNCPMTVQLSSLFQANIDICIGIIKFLSILDLTPVENDNAPQTTDLLVTSYWPLVCNSQSPPITLLVSFGLCSIYPGGLRQKTK